MGQLLVVGFSSLHTFAGQRPELIPDPLGYWFDPDVTNGSGISVVAVGFNPL